MTLPRAILVDPNDGCLRIARVLRARGVDVHVLARPRSAYVTRSRGVRGRVLAPVGEDPGAWLAALEELGADRDGVLIPGSDDGSELIARERASIPERLRSFEGPGTVHLELMDKARLYERAVALGLRIPWTVRVDDLGALDDPRIELPCIVKPALGHVGKQARGNYGTTFVESRAALETLCRAALEEGVDVLATEWVPGGEEELEGAVTVRLADGSYPVEWGRRKVRQYPLDFGQGSLTRSASVPATLAINRRLLDDAGYAGVSSLEVKRHATTGERVLIEINVRVVQSFGLGDACGVDASWRLYLALAGLPIGPRPPQRDGVAVLSPAFDLMAVRQRMRRGELGWRQLAASYRGTRELSVLDLRDPAPGVELARWFLRRRRAR